MGNGEEVGEVLDGGVVVGVGNGDGREDLREGVHVEDVSRIVAMSFCEPRSCV